MPNRSRKPPADPNLAATSILAQITDEEPRVEPPAKNPAAVELGRKGGLRGGRARAEAMTPEERKRSASDAAKRRKTENHGG